MKTLAAMALTLSVTVGCSRSDGGGTAVADSAGAPAAAAPVAAPANPKQATVDALTFTQAFIKATEAKKLSMNALTVYKEDTDPNKLLGRPGQYLAKIGWKVEDGDATLEVFASSEDATKRKEYTEAIGKSSPMFLQYVYLNKRAVLRLPKELTPTQAKEWEAAFSAL